MTGLGVEIIASERRRQVDQGLFTSENDDAQDGGELIEAAGCYCGFSRPWPWSDIDYPTLDDVTPDCLIATYAKAGALIAAEIERLTRLGKTVGREEIGA